jgi:hypothetical protein
MLAFANEGFKGLELNVAGAEGGLDCFSEGGDLFGRELDCAVKAVKDPSQDFFDCVPEAFPFGD